MATFVHKKNLRQNLPLPHEGGNRILGRIFFKVREQSSNKRLITIASNLLSSRFLSLKSVRKNILMNFVKKIKNERASKINIESEIFMT